MSKSHEDWVKKCMEFRIEGRILVGRPIRPWLENVEADMADLRSTENTLRKNATKMKSNPIGKRTINR